MHVGRFIANGETRIGRFEQGSVVELEAESFPAVLEYLTTGKAMPSGVATFEVEEIEHLPPTTSKNAVFAAALNYQSHADEAEEAIPDRPLLFLKLPRSLVGHKHPITPHASVTNDLDYEAELAAVIGTPAWHVDASEALQHVAGYTICNDISARDVQRVAVGDSTFIDWLSGKSMAETSPLGPYVTTPDSLPDPHDLHIESRLNDEVMQDESTEYMIRGVDELIAFASTRVQLEPGDVIATGTPEGVGTFQDVRIVPGDRIDITIDGIGTLSNVVGQSLDGAS